VSAKPCPNCGQPSLFSKKRKAFHCSECELTFEANEHGDFDAGNQFFSRVEAQQQRGQVFLSYGRDASCSNLVRRIKADLELLGWKTWLDESIQTGDDWRREITKGINESQHVLAFLSEHSTRKPGVCRQEVAIALGPKRGHVYTVLVESVSKVTPPLIISHLQWLDMQEWDTLIKTNSEQAEVLYKKSFPKIVQVLERNEPFSGEIEELRRWLQPWDGTADLVSSEQGFTGRRWLLDGIVEAPWWGAGQEQQTNQMGIGEIERWCSSLDEGRVFWLSAGPGWGKSSVVAQLAHAARSRILAVHFCRHDQPQTKDARTVIRSIAFQMATQLGDYRESLILRCRSELPIHEFNAKELFTQLIANLLTVEVGGGREMEGRRLIVLDAVDETLESGRSELVELISSEFSKLPKWLGLLVTSRREAAIDQQLGAYGVHHQHEIDPRNEGDLQAYASQWVDTLPLQRHEKIFALKSIIQSSAGMFLYLKKLQEAVAHKIISPNDLLDAGKLPRGLSALYHLWFGHRFIDVEAYQSDQAPLLDMLLASCEPLPVELCQSVLGHLSYASAREPLGSLLREEQGRLGFFHKSLADWLSNVQWAGPFFADPLRGHERLANHLWGSYEIWKSKGALFDDQMRWEPFGEMATQYALAHLPAHMRLSNRMSEHEDLLTDFAFTMLRVANRQVAFFLKDHQYERDHPSRAGSNTLKTWARYWFSNGHLLRKGNPRWPTHRILLQMALEADDKSPIALASHSWLTSGRHDWSVLFAHRRLKVDQSLAISKVIQAPPHPGRETLPQFTAICLGRSGDQVWAGMNDGRVFRLDPSSDELKCLASLNQAISSLSASPTQDEVVVCGKRGDLFLGSSEKLMSAPQTWTTGIRASRSIHSPDGKHLAFANRSQLRWVSLQLSLDGDVAEIECGQGLIKDLAWSSPGSLVVTVGESGDVRWWDINDSSCRRTIKLPWPKDIPLEKQKSNSVALSKDGRLCLVGSVCGLLFLFDPLDARSMVCIPAHQGAVHSVDVAPDGDWAASGGADGVVRVWNLFARGELAHELKGHAHLVTSVLIDAKRQRVFSAGSDGTLRTWPVLFDLQPESETPISAQTDSIMASEVCSITQMNDDALVLGHKDGQIQAFNLPLFSSCMPLTAMDQEVWANCTSLDGQFICAAAFKGMIRKWNALNGELVAENCLPFIRIYGLKCIDTEHMLCWGVPLNSGPISSSILKVRQSDLGIQSDSSMPDLGHVRSLKTTQDGLCAYAAGQGGSLVAWNVNTCLEVWKELSAHEKTIYAMDLTSDEKRLATAGADRVIQIRDAQTGRLMRSITGHTAAVTSLCFFSDGIRLVSVSWDGTVCMWNTQKGSLLSVAHVPNVSKALLLKNETEIIAGTTSGEVIGLDLSWTQVRK
jgi:WD40 repeat protein